MKIVFALLTIIHISQCPIELKQVVYWQRFKRNTHAKTDLCLLLVTGLPKIHPITVIRFTDEILLTFIQIINVDIDERINDGTVIIEWVKKLLNRKTLVYFQVAHVAPLHLFLFFLLFLYNKMSLPKVNYQSPQTCMLQSDSLATHVHSISSIDSCQQQQHSNGSRKILYVLKILLWIFYYTGCCPYKLEAEKNGRYVLKSSNTQKVILRINHSWKNCLLKSQLSKLSNLQFFFVILTINVLYTNLKNVYDTCKLIPNISAGLFQFAFGIASVIANCGTFLRFLSYHFMFCWKKDVIQRIIFLIANFNFLHYRNLNNRYFLVR